MFYVISFRVEDRYLITMIIYLLIAIFQHSMKRRILFQIKLLSKLENKLFYYRKEKILFLINFSFQMQYYKKNETKQEMSRDSIPPFPIVSHLLKI